EDRLRPVDLGTRVDELIGIQLVAAVVALISARARESADRARTFYVAIGQRAARGLLKRAHRRPLDQVALVVQGLEDVLHDDAMVLRRRSREQVVRETKRSQVIADDP